MTIKNITLKTHDARYLHISNPGKPVLIVLPGNLQEIESLAAFNERLSPHFDYYALELPGVGMTKPLHAYYTIAYLADCLKDFMHDQELDAVHLLACSYATAIALEFTKDTSQVTRLAIVGGMSHIPQDLIGDTLSIMSDSLSGNRDIFAERVIKLLTSDNDLIPRRRAIQKAAKAKAKTYTDDQMWCFVSNSTRLMSYSPTNLENITCPTLCTTGEFDPYVTVKSCRALSELMPHSQFTMIPGADHLCLLEKPKDTCDLILNFLLNKNS